MSGRLAARRLSNLTLVRLEIREEARTHGCGERLTFKRLVADTDEQGQRLVAIAERGAIRSADREFDPANEPEYPVAARVCTDAACDGMGADAKFDVAAIRS